MLLTVISDYQPPNHQPHLWTKRAVALWFAIGAFPCGSSTHHPLPLALATEEDHGHSAGEHSSAADQGHHSSTHWYLVARQVCVCVRVGDRSW